MIRRTSNGKAASLLAAISAFFFATSASAISPGTGLTKVWSTYEYGQALGARGLGHVDVDGDGRPETIFGSVAGAYPYGVETWSVQEYVPAKKTYRIRWQSEGYPSGISALKVFPASGAGQQIYVGGGDGTIEIFDAATLSRVASFASAGEVRDFAIGDADNNGTVDIVVLHQAATELFDPVSHALRRSIPYGGQSFGLGEVDGNGRLDLVYNTGYFITQRGATTMMKWNNSANGFGNHLGLADIDGDGKAEIIFDLGWYYLRAVDGDIRSVKWEHHSDLDIGAMRLLDFDGDGDMEVVYGDGQWGALHLLDGADGNSLGSVENPNHGVTGIDAFDTDGDGTVELVWGSGYSSSGPDNLYIAALGGPIEWASDEVDGAFLSDVGDVDGDGNPDIVTASLGSDSGYGDGIISIYGAATHALKWRSPSNFFSSFAWTNLHDLKLADLDGDGVMEILIATDRLYDGALYIIDGRKHTLSTSYFFDDGSPLTSLAVGDVDGDNVLDIVAGGGYAHSGSPGRYVYVINPANGAVKWHSYSLGNEVSQVGIANVDDDAAMEIVALADGHLYVFDGISHENWQSDKADYSVFAFSAPGIGGKVRVYAGTEDGQMRNVGFAAHRETFLDSFCGARLEALAMHVQLYYACGGQLGAYDLGSKAVVKLSLPSDPALGYANSIAFINNGNLVLGGALRVTQFKRE